MHAITAGLFYLEASVEGERARKRIFDRSGLATGESLKTMFFSDTLVRSCLPNPAESTLLTDAIQKFCQGLVGNGLYPRGAIVVGDLAHAENGTILGPALLDAHDIERSVAKYPRIIVSGEAAPLLKRVVGQNPTKYGPSQVRTDRADGLRFFDIFPMWIPGKRPRVRARGRAQGAPPTQGAPPRRQVGTCSPGWGPHHRHPRQASVDAPLPRRRDCGAD